MSWFANKWLVPDKVFRQSDFNINKNVRWARCLNLLKGCAFHWCQAVWRKACDLGLRTSYLRHGGVHKYIRMCLALPFLPSTHIREAFHSLEVQAVSQGLRGLLTYIKTAWIDGSVAPPESWSVYGQAIRTNNDTEGWHRRLNGRVNNSAPPFYQLITLLYQEAQLLKLQMRLVSDKKLKKKSKKKDQNCTSKIFLCLE